MVIYKWKCNHCGYISIEPVGTTEAEARKNKASHIGWCGKPTSSEAKQNTFDSLQELIEKWV